MAFEKGDFSESSEKILIDSSNLTCWVCLLGAIFSFLFYMDCKIKLPVTFFLCLCMGNPAFCGAESNAERSCAEDCGVAV